MFHMLSSFNLASEVDRQDFARRLGALGDLLVAKDLVVSVGSINRRQRHPVMDTDQRDHQYSFVMTFRDREQCDVAVAEMYRDTEPLASVHKSVYGIIEDPVFSCWQEIG